MWWVAEAPFSKVVTVEWVRSSTSESAEFESRSGGGIVTRSVGRETRSVGRETSVSPREVPRDRESPRDRQVITGATWTQKGQTHYISYDDPIAGDEAAEGAQSRSRTLIKVEPTLLTVLRYGEIQWNQTFREGLDQSSTMNVSGMSMPVRTLTRSLTTEVSPTGGTVQIHYVLEVAGDQQVVDLTLRFEV